MYHFAKKYDAEIAICGASFEENDPLDGCRKCCQCQHDKVQCFCQTVPPSTKRCKIQCDKCHTIQPIFKIIHAELKRGDEKNETDNVVGDSSDYCAVCEEELLTRKEELLNSRNDGNIVRYSTDSPFVAINILRSESDDKKNNNFPKLADDNGIANQAFEEEDEALHTEENEKKSNKTSFLGLSSKCGFDVFTRPLEWNKSVVKSSGSIRSNGSSRVKATSMRKRRATLNSLAENDKRRESIKNMLFGDPNFARRFSQDLHKLNRQETTDDSDETLKVIFLQVFIPFLIAGFGNVGAGLILDYCQHWDVFQTITELFVLVASFLGFKGNLEMTLAARLSTQANLGNLDKSSEQWRMGCGNIALIQCQAIVVAFLAAIIAILMNVIKEWQFELDHALLICATSLITASVTGFFLASLMITVIIISRKTGVNPDNVSTLIAAFMGDITAVIMLAGTAKILFIVRHIVWIAPIIIIFFAFLLPLFVILTKRNEFTSDVVNKGWWPIILAMVISSIGGFIFDFAVELFEMIAIFQPIINGVGSNLVAVQASRISTYLHQRCSLGDLPPAECGVVANLCQSPHHTFIGTNPNVRTARLLLLMSIPGHVIYIGTIKLIKFSSVSMTAPFIIFYLLAAIIQVSILLYIAHLLVPFLWTKKIDPDNSAIPGIMATGDLIGTALLTTAFFILVALHDPNVAPASRQLTSSI